MRLKKRIPTSAVGLFSAICQRKASLPSKFCHAIIQRLKAERFARFKILLLSAIVGSALVHDAGFVAVIVNSDLLLKWSKKTDKSSVNVQ
jgi:hypothetical protein